MQNTPFLRQIPSFHQNHWFPKLQPKLLSSQELEALVGAITSPSSDVKKIGDSLTALSGKLKEASSTMTSVPKPLKFLRVHYETLKTYYLAKRDLTLKQDMKVRQLFADILSVLAAVKSPPKLKKKEGEVDPEKEKEKEQEEKKDGDVEMKDASGEKKEGEGEGGKTFSTLKSLL